MFFCRALVLSRLLYNVVTWTMTVTALGKLNTAYMRVVRRIAGECRFSASTELSDLQVREKVNAASIDCIVFVKRLLYYRRVACNTPKLLWALMQQHAKGQPLLYVRQMVQDFAVLQRRLPEAMLIPCASEAPQRWLDLMMHKYCKSCDWAHSIHYVESILDKKPAPQQIQNNVVNAFVGPECCVSFPTEKALGAHARTKHGDRTPIKQYVDDTGVCPICKSFYRTRIRVIAHLSDRRRPMCRDLVLAGEVPLLDPNIAAQLEDRDRQLLRDARKAGATHVMAVGSATDARGRRLGHVQR